MANQPSLPTGGIVVFDRTYVGYKWLNNSDNKTGKKYWFLTNQMDWYVKTIAEVYKEHGHIEYSSSSYRTSSHLPEQVTCHV